MPMLRVSRYLEDLPYRDCQLVADQYTRQVTDAGQAKKIADIKASVVETKKIIEREDPRLINPSYDSKYL